MGQVSTINQNLPSVLVPASSGGGAKEKFDSSNPAHVALLKDDREFLRLVQDASVEGRNNPGKSAVLSMVANTDLSTLTPEERAQIIDVVAHRDMAQVRNMPWHYKPLDTAAVDALLKKLSNNQGYTGPGASEVAVALPSKNGGSLQVTKGQLYDNENFGALADQAFTAAGGQAKELYPLSHLPDRSRYAILSGGVLNERSNIGGLPSVVINSKLQGAQMEKWSEAERIEFLKTVSEFGKDGSLSQDENQTLLKMVDVNNRSNNGAVEEPSAVMGANGKPVISKDDITENGTLKNKLTEMISPANYLMPRHEFVGVRAIDQDAMVKQKELVDLIYKADFRKLSYGERVALVKAIDAATADNRLTAAEVTEITAQLAGYLASSGGVGSQSGTTLSNGYFVKDSDVASDDQFGGAVQKTLIASGVKIDGNNSPGSFGTSYPLELLRMDVTKLTPEQRMDVLEMIASAGSDGKITAEEGRKILDDVARLNGDPVGPLASRNINYV
jgi:hypothetical protein